MQSFDRSRFMRNSPKQASIVILFCAFLASCAPFPQNATVYGNMPDSEANPLAAAAAAAAGYPCTEEAGTAVQDAILGSILDAVVDGVLGSFGGGGGSVAATGRKHLKNYMAAKGKDYLKT